LRAAGQSRLITPDEVAAAVLDCCLDDAARRNGETILVEAPA
jgi:hypothetical protein